MIFPIYEQKVFESSSLKRIKNIRLVNWLVSIKKHENIMSLIKVGTLLEELFFEFLEFDNKEPQHALSLIDMKLKLFDQLLSVGLVYFIESVLLTSDNIKLETSWGVFVLFC